jgi:two-component system, OmpR family, response regulator QseB
LVVGIDDPEAEAGLERLGHRLIGVATALEARQEVSSGRFDAMVTDVDLGDDDGIELVRWVRAAGLSLPVVIVSSRSEPRLVVAGLDAGADDFVIRPIPVEILDAQLNALLRRWRARPRGRWGDGSDERPTI